MLMLQKPQHTTKYTTTKKKKKRYNNNTGIHVVNVLLLLLLLLLVRSHVTEVQYIIQDFRSIVTTHKCIITNATPSI